MESKKFDVIVIGGGPNGLTAGCYLAKAGQKVLIVDRRSEIGGGCAMEQSYVKHFWHNTHAIYFPMVDCAPAYKDLQLDQYPYNLKHIYPPHQFAMLFKDGRSISLYSDVEKSVNSISRFSQKDAKNYKDLYIEAKTLFEEFIAPATYIPPYPTLDALMSMSRTEVGRKVQVWGEQSPVTFVNEHFENDKVKALMMHTICMWGLDPEAAGLGFLIPLYINRSTNYRLAVNTSHSLTQALIKHLYANGGKILAPKIIKRIIVEGGIAKGIEFSNGVIVEAEKAVLSTLDTHQTFLDLVGEDKLSKDFVQGVKGWQWEHWSFFTVHIDLEAAPQFIVPDVDSALIYIMGCESAEDVVEHYRIIGQGEVGKESGFTCSFPTLHDPTQAPPGKHTGLISKMVPYRLKEGKDQWYSFKFKQEQAMACMELLRRYAPNLTDDNIRAFFVNTPLDTENRFSNMVEGSIKQGAYTLLQMGYNRPNPECSQHRSPIKNLYMGGACTYPGGTVLMAIGYLAANAVADDFGIKKWWPEPEMVTKARQKGIL